MKYSLFLSAMIMRKHRTQARALASFGSTRLYLVDWNLTIASTVGENRRYNPIHSSAPETETNSQDLGHCRRGDLKPSHSEASDYLLC